MFRKSANSLLLKKGFSSLESNDRYIFNSVEEKEQVKSKNQDRHQKYYHQNYYREKELKRIIESSGLGHWKEIDEKNALESGNYLRIPLKKCVEKNDTNISYIYKTWFFLHDTREDIMEQKNNNLPNLIVPYGRNIFFSRSLDNSLSSDKENTPSYTKTNQGGKVSQKYNHFTVKKFLTGKMPTWNKIELYNICLSKEPFQLLNQILKN